MNTLEDWGAEGRENWWLWGGMCFLAGSWRFFKHNFDGGLWGNQRPWHCGIYRSWIWSILGRWNQAWGLPLQPVWPGFDVYAGSAISREESLGSGHVYPGRQVQLPVLLLCLCFQAQVSCGFYFCFQKKHKLSLLFCGLTLKSSHNLILSNTFLSI